MYGGRLEEEEEGEEVPFHSKPAKKSFVMVMFQQSVSNLLHTVFCSFPNSFLEVSVVNMVQGQKGQQCPKVFWRQNKSPSLSADVYA